MYQIFIEGLFARWFWCHATHMSLIYRKSALARLPSEESAVVCLGFAQTEGVGLSPLLHLN